MTEDEIPSGVFTLELLQQAIKKLRAAPVYRREPIYLPPGVTLDDLVDELRPEGKVTP